MRSSSSFSRAPSSAKKSLVAPLGVGLLQAMGLSLAKSSLLSNIYQLENLGSNEVALCFYLSLGAMALGGAVGVGVLFRSGVTKYKNTFAFLFACLLFGFVVFLVSAVVSFSILWLILSWFFLGCGSLALWICLQSYLQAVTHSMFWPGMTSIAVLVGEFLGPVVGLLLSLFTQDGEIIFKKIKLDGTNIPVYFGLMFTILAAILCLFGLRDVEGTIKWTSPARVFDSYFDCPARPLTGSVWRKPTHRFLRLMRYLCVISVILLSLVDLSLFPIAAVSFGWFLSPRLCIILGTSALTTLLSIGFLVPIRKYLQTTGTALLFGSICSLAISFLMLIIFVSQLVSESCYLRDQEACNSKWLFFVSVVGIFFSAPIVIFESLHIENRLRFASVAPSGISIVLISIGAGRVLIPFLLALVGVISSFKITLLVVMCITYVGLVGSIFVLIFNLSGIRTQLAPANRRQMWQNQLLRFQS